MQLLAFDARSLRGSIGGTAVRSKTCGRGRSDSKLGLKDNELRQANALLVFPWTHTELVAPLRAVKMLATK